MALQLIRKYGDPILRKKAIRVEDFGPALQQLVVDMTDTMEAAQGVGLAANQIGRTESLCIVDEGLLVEGAPVRAFVNPRVVEEGQGESDMEEGCLSIPEIREDVSRKVHIRVHYQDLEGREHEEVFQDMLARVLQHEIDHLNGVFFVDRLSSVRRKLLSKKLRAIAEEAHHDAVVRKEYRAAIDRA